jgi:hypothetical protein
MNKLGTGQETAGASYCGIATKANEIAMAAGAVGGRVLAIGSVTTVQTIAASMSPNSRVAFALSEEKW